MAFSAHEVCPGCQTINEIFIEEQQIPAMDSWFRYKCPSCEKTIICVPRAYSTDVEIPSDGTVAVRQAAPAVVKKQ